MSLAERDTQTRARRFPLPASFPSSRSGADLRGAALVVLGASATIAMLWWAQAVVVPILVSLLISHALEPAVGFLERHHVPRALGVFVVLMSVVAASGYGVYALGDPASNFVDQMPSQAQKLRMQFERRTREGSNPIDRVQQAANEIERAAGAATKAAPAPAGVQRVRIEEPPFHIGDLAWRGSRGLIDFMAALAVIFFLTYYLLLAGDVYRHKIARIAGTTFSRRRRVVRILHDIDEQIRKYLLARALISAIVAVATGGALAALGMKQAVMWGVVAGVLNVIPYVGPLAAIAGIAIAGFAQFDNLTQTGFVVAAASAVAFVEGNIITPKLAGRAGNMNAVSIFTGILFWGWLWGVSGMLLAVPLMTAIKAICSRVDRLEPIAELLSE